MTDSFWTIPDVETIITPLSLIKNQAAQLTSATGGVLRGRVESTGGDRVMHDLKIVVPGLNHYEYSVLGYQQEVVRLYPGLFVNHVEQDNHNVDDERVFIDLLKKTLSSPAVSKVIGALLSQAGSGTKPKWSSKG